MNISIFLENITSYTVENTLEIFKANYPFQTILSQASYFLLEYCKFNFLFQSFPFLVAGKNDLHIFCISRARVSEQCRGRIHKTAWLSLTPVVKEKKRLQILRAKPTSNNDIFSIFCNKWNIENKSGFSLSQKWRRIQVNSK